jgi:hypothetical protein
MPCAPPKEEEVRVGYLRQLLRATQVLYAKGELEFKKKIKKKLFILCKKRTISFVQVVFKRIR